MLLTVVVEDRAMDLKIEGVVNFSGTVGRLYMHSVVQKAVTAVLTWLYH